MVRLGRLNAGWGSLLFIPLATAALAHTVKVSGDVAATFHIEPDHHPQAGQPAQAWFALTQRGGKMIPLSQCSCRLKIYLNPYRPGDVPTLAPVLKPMSTEQYKDIPSAEMTFPRAGVYALEISGTPKAGAQFQPFEQRYDVTVSVAANPSERQNQAVSQSHHSAPDPSPAAENPSSSALLERLLRLGSITLGLCALVYGGWRFKTRRHFK